MTGRDRSKHRESESTPSRTLQQDPPEGSRDVVEGELRRQDQKGKSAKPEAAEKTDDPGEQSDPLDIIDSTAGLP